MAHGRKKGGLGLLGLPCCIFSQGAFMHFFLQLQHCGVEFLLGTMLATAKHIGSQGQHQQHHGGFERKCQWHRARNSWRKFEIEIIEL